jgi:LPXTG-site transpeptidase (sortase) family protein
VSAFPFLRPGVLPGRRTGGLRRWSAPVLQAATLAAVLTVDAGLVAAARADVAAERGEGPRIATTAVQRQVAPPVTLGIPGLDLTTRLIGLRKARDGSLQVPEDPQRVGWYSQGPAPGDAGPAVLVGHVDSYRGAGVFARLHQLVAGDQIRIRRADGTLVVFEVRQVQEYAKRDFPTEVVYRGSSEATLRLITCGGEFDQGSRSYRSNVVVFAAPVAGQDS